MVKSWGIQRKNSRVALSLPLRVEGQDTESPVKPFDTVAEDISRDGFRIRVNPEEEPPGPLEAGRDYPVILVYGKRRLKAIIRIMWRNESHIGIRFVERDKGWIIS